MAIYAEVQKVSENEQQVRYSFSSSENSERFMILDKTSERSWPEDGVNNILYQAVARKVAVTWIREGEAPERLIVQS
ncbi:hypothetical protein ACGFSB_21590 [Streptomyces sp. NPDC048441]|uniref:hypothetical protein n=1 Tax=Streptomyces sp. NPDC048441 TaxID=3365552 RepID=UPI00371029B9